MRSPTLQDRIRDTRIIVSHAGCSDGILAAALCRDALPNAEVRFVQYGPTRDALVPDYGMLFVDMTPPESKTRAFIASAAIVLDHHVSQMAQITEFEAAGLGVYADEPGCSGAVLAYRHVWCPAQHDVLREDVVLAGGYGVVGDLARLVGLRDTWQRDHADFERSQCLHEAVMLLGESWASGPFVSEVLYGDWSDRISTGRLLRNRQQRRVAELISEAQEFDVQPVHHATGFERILGSPPSPSLRLLVLPGSSQDTSDAAEMLDGKCKRCDGVGRIYLDYGSAANRALPVRECPDCGTSGKRSCPDLIAGFRYKGRALLVSLRSHRGVDCSLVAKRYGGGGHRAAAGFSLTSLSEPYARVVEAIEEALR